MPPTWRCPPGALVCQDVGARLKQALGTRLEGGGSEALLSEGCHPRSSVAVSSTGRMTRVPG